MFCSDSLRKALALCQIARMLGSLNLVVATVRWNQIITNHWSICIQMNLRACGPETNAINTQGLTVQRRCVFCSGRCVFHLYFERLSCETTKQNPGSDDGALVRCVSRHFAALSGHFLCSCGKPNAMGLKMLEQRCHLVPWKWQMCPGFVVCVAFGLGSPGFFEITLTLLELLCQLTQFASPPLGFLLTCPPNLQHLDLKERIITVTCNNSSNNDSTVIIMYSYVVSWMTQCLDIFGYPPQTSHFPKVFVEHVEHDPSPGWSANWRQKHV